MKEALKMALEALKIVRDQIVDPEYGPIGWDVSRLDEVLSAGKQALAAQQERNFCPRCGKRTADLTTIHTCTPPQEST